MHEFDQRLSTMAIECIRLIKRPFTYNGWINIVSRKLEIDIDKSTGLVDELINFEYLLFTRIIGKQNIYASDRTPEYFRWLVGKDTFKYDTHN